MTCATCVARIEQALAAVPGVLNASVNLASETASVELVAGVASARDLLAAIERAGYRGSLIAHTSDRDAAARDSLASLRRDALLALALAIPLLAGTHLSAVGIDWMMPAWLQWLLATPVQLWCARRFYVAARRAVRARTGNMDLLVSLGTLAAYGLSLYVWLEGGWGRPARSHLYSKRPPSSSRWCCSASGSKRAPSGRPPKRSACLRRCGPTALRSCATAG
jgi:Cu+-exporting ATPase